MFLVIDGSSMLVTEYYANLPNEIKFEKDEEKQKLYYDKILKNSAGEYTNALYGMTKRLLNIIKNQQPEYLAVVFDKSRNTFRRELCADYKAQRKQTPAPLKEQMIAMQKILNDLGIACFASDVYEADDLAGSIIKKFEGPDCPIRFMTKDHDYLQLISDYTRGWMFQASEDALRSLYDHYLSFWGNDIKNFNIPDRVFEFTAETVLGEEGVYPLQIIDKKALCGDKSDNIPGVKGVGDTSVIPLLMEYQSVEGIYEALDDCLTEADEKELAKFWKESLGIKRSPIKLLKEGRDMAFLSKKLATIKTDCEVPDSLESYKYSIGKELMKNILEHYEFSSLMHFCDDLGKDGGEVIRITEDDLQRGAGAEKE